MLIIQKVNIEVSVMKLCRPFLVLFLFFISSAQASATPHLVDWGFNENGFVYGANEGTHPLEQYLPAHFNITGFNWDAGVGVITITYTIPGEYHFVSYFDYEVVQGQNTYFNEWGEVIGVPLAVQSWEIDELGWVSGNLYDHLLSGELDNTNRLPAGSEDDVTLAMGWRFSLQAGSVAVIRLTLSEKIPETSFYLAHWDPEGSHYLSSTLSVISGVPVPEPCSILLFIVGLAGLAGIWRSAIFR
jgi:hypothetical protein